MLAIYNSGSLRFTEFNHKCKKRVGLIVDMSYVFTVKSRSPHYSRISLNNVNQFVACVCLIEGGPKIVSDCMAKGYLYCTYLLL